MVSELLHFAKGERKAGAETEKPDPLGGRSWNGLCLEQKPDSWIDLVQSPILGTTVAIDPMSLCLLYTSRSVHFATAVIPCFPCFREPSRHWRDDVRGALVWPQARSAIYSISGSFYFDINSSIISNGILCEV
jgi:hypothetical protein